MAFNRVLRVAAAFALVMAGFSAAVHAQPVPQSAVYDELTNEFSIVFDTVVITTQEMVLFDAVVLDDDQGGPRADYTLRGGTVIGSEELNNTLAFRPMFGGIIDSYMYKDAEGTEIQAECWGLDYDDLIEIENSLNHDQLTISIPEGMVIDEDGNRCEAAVLPLEYIPTPEDDLTHLVDVTYNAIENMIYFTFDNTVRYDQIAEDFAGYNPDNPGFPGPGNGILDTNPPEDRNGNGVLDLEPNVRLTQIVYADAEGKTFTPGSALDMTRRDSTVLMMELSRDYRISMEQLDLSTLTVSFTPFTFVDMNFNPVEPVTEQPITVVPDTVPLIAESAQYNLRENRLTTWFNQDLFTGLADYIVLPKFGVHGEVVVDNVVVDSLDMSLNGGSAGTDSVAYGCRITLTVDDAKEIEDFYWNYAYAVNDTTTDSEAEFTLTVGPNAVLSPLENGNILSTDVPLEIVPRYDDDSAPMPDSASYNAATNQLYVKFNIRLDLNVDLAGFTFVSGNDTIPLTGGTFKRTSGNKALLITLNGENQSAFEWSEGKENATLNIESYSVFQQTKLNGNHKVSGLPIYYVNDPVPPLPEYVFYDYREDRLIVGTVPALPPEAIDLTKMLVSGVRLSEPDSVLNGADSLVQGDTDKLYFYLNPSDVTALENLADTEKEDLEITLEEGCLSNGDGVTSVPFDTLRDRTHLVSYSTDPEREDSSEADLLIGYGRDFIVHAKQVFPSEPVTVHASIRKISQHAEWYVANDQWVPITMQNGIDHYNSDTGALVPLPDDVIPMNQAQVDSAAFYFETASPRFPDVGAHDKILEIFAGDQADRVPDRVLFLFADVYDDYGEDGRNDSDANLRQPGYFLTDDLPGSGAPNSNEAELIVLDSYPQNFNDPDKVVYTWSKNNARWDEVSGDEVNTGLAAVTNLFTQYVTYKVDPYEEHWVRVGMAYLAEFLVGRKVELVDDSLVVDVLPEFYGFGVPTGLSGGNILTAIGADYNSRVDQVHLFMFFLYMWEKYGGTDLITQICESPRIGVNAIERVIEDADYQASLDPWLQGKSLRQIYLDMATANLLDTTYADDHGIYNFDNINTRSGVRGGQFKWKNTPGVHKAPYTRHSFDWSFTYNYTSFGVYDPNVALGRDENGNVTDNLILFTGTDAENILFRKLNVRVSNLASNLGQEYLTQDFTGDAWDSEIGRGEVPMSPGNGWELNPDALDPNNTDSTLFPMWILIAAGEGDFIVTNEEEGADYSGIYIAQNQTFTRKIDIFAVSQLPIYNANADPAPLVYATSDPEGLDTLVSYDDPEDYIITEVSNDMGNYSLYLCGGWMSDPGTYYWRLSGFYANGVPVNLETTVISVTQLPSGAPGRLELGEAFRISTSSAALAHDQRVSVVGLPGEYAPLSSSEIVRLPDDPERTPVSKIYSCSPEDLILDDPAVLTMQFDQATAAGEPVGIYYLRNNSWVYVGGSVDRDGGTVTTRITRLGTYRVMAGETGDVPDDLRIPTEYVLRQNYPNPFNPNTTIAFQLPASGHVSLVVYDILGREVTKLVNGDMRFGTHLVVWDGKSRQGTPLASGMYFVRLQAGGFTDMIKMVLVK